MKQEHKKYILENIGRKSFGQIAKELNVPERKIKRFLMQIRHSDNKKTIPTPEKSPNKPLNKKTLFITVILIITLGFIAYASSLTGKFVWDDEFLIKDNAFIKSLPGITDCFTKNIFAGAGMSSNFYRPLQMITYALDYSIWKLNVTGYHLTNILLHILVSLCIYWLINILFNDKILSLIAAMFFVTHPIHTTVVSYISTRAEELYLLFMLVSFMFYIKSLKSNRLIHYIIMVLSYVLAFLSKENSLILPILILLYHYTFKEKIRLREFLSISALALIYILLRMTVLKYLLTDMISNGTLLQRIPGFFVAMTTYVRLLLLPFDLHIEYGSNLFSFTDPKAICGLLILTGLIFCIFKTMKTNKLIFFSLSWFTITLLPISNLYPINAYMSENWLYLPSIGFFLVMAYPLTLIYNDKRYKTLGLTLIIFCLLFYSGLTIKQNDYWKEPLAFYDRTLKFAPGSARCYNNRGIIYNDKGSYDQSISDCTRAIQLDSNYAEAYNNRGIAYTGKDNYDEAISDFTKAIQLNPNFSKAYNNRGFAYNAKSNYDQAISDFTKAIQLDSNYAEAYNNRGIAYTGKDNYDEAISDFTKAIQLNPNFSKAYNNRGLAYTARGKYDQAILDYNKAIQINPNYAKVYNNRAGAYYYKNEFDKARADVDKTESLGHKVSSQLIEALKKASGREK